MDERIEIVRAAVTNPATPWVLFSGGTVVFLPGQHERHEEVARQTLRDWGPVQSGSPAGDFSVISFEGGWFVSCHHPDILTLVTPDDLDPAAMSEPQIGLFGRQKRDHDAASLEVLHVEPAQAALDAAPAIEGELVGELSDEPRLAAAQQALLDGNPDAMSNYLFAGDEAVFLEAEGDGVTVYRERQMPGYLPDPWVELYLEKISRATKVRQRRGPKGLELRQRGALYVVSAAPIQECDADLTVTGIDHTGKMRGAAPQAVLRRWGEQVEVAAQQELAHTDRSLGTAVFTSRPGPGASAGWLGHVVSTPLSSDKPEWIRRAVFQVLNKARTAGCFKVAMIALGTNGGVSAESCARATMSACQQWFQEQPVALMVILSLPGRKTREAFIGQLRQDKLFYTET